MVRILSTQEELNRINCNGWIAFKLETACITNRQNAWKNITGANRMIHTALRFWHVQWFTKLTRKSELPLTHKLAKRFRLTSCDAAIWRWRELPRNLIPYSRWEGRELLHSGLFYIWTDCYAARVRLLKERINYLNWKQRGNEKEYEVSINHLLKYLSVKRNCDRVQVKQELIGNY